MGELLIVRHAESVLGNLDKYSGITDTPLSGEGVMQIIKIAALLPKIDFDIVYTSTLVRTMETALIFLSQLEPAKMPVRILRNELDEFLQKTECLPVVEIAEINERNYGILEAQDKITIAKKYDKETVRRWRRAFYEGPPDGETFEMVVNRVELFLNNELLVKLNKGHNILLVAHQNSIRALYYKMMNPKQSELEHIEFENFGGLHFGFENGRFELLGTFGDKDKSLSVD